MSPQASSTGSASADKKRADVFHISLPTSLRADVETLAKRMSDAAKQASGIDVPFSPAQVIRSLIQAKLAEVESADAPPA